MKDSSKSQLLLKPRHKLGTDQELDNMKAKLAKKQCYLAKPEQLCHNIEQSPLLS